MPEFLLADGARLHIEEHEGARPDVAPIVLLHGILSSAASWRRVAQRLSAAGRRVLVPEARGHGASSPEVADWSPLAAAEDVEEWLTAQHPDGVHLVGHSRGGTAASWVAVEAPRLARSLALVASPPQATEVFRATFRKQLEALPPDAPERTRGALAYLKDVPDDAFPAHALRRYRGRALVVEHEDDPLYSPVGTMFWRLFLPYADFERIPGGHLLHETEDGARWLAERLLRHVEAAEAAAPEE